MKIKISGFGSIAGYTVLMDDDLDWLFDNVGTNPTDDELKEFCEDERIWDEIRFKYKISGPSVSAKVFIDDKPIAKTIETDNTVQLPKLTNMSGDDGILTLIKDYKGIWFKGTINSNSFDSNKLEFETTIIGGAELITKVFYNKKEIVNEIIDPLITNYNTYANLKF
jgi:hypothetical protein